MSLLPKIDSPIYDLTLPISKKEIKFRPYTVKEQKILLMAVEAKDNSSLINAISQIIGNCVITGIDTNKLLATDVEFLFYNLRARSQSETVELHYICENFVNDEFCKGKLSHRLNLLTDLEITEGMSETVALSDTMGIKLNHQRFEPNSFDKEETLTPEQEFTLVAKNIDFIYDEKSSYNASDIPIKDLVEWLGNLTIEQYSKIGEFFLNEPKIHKKFDVTCKKCGIEHHLDVEDIFDFFS